MNLTEWEPTIGQIADESKHEPTEGFQDNLLLAWRAKLAKEPTFSRSFQIDILMREVRKKLTAASR